MGGSSSGNPNATAYNPDQDALQKYVSTTNQGKKYAGAFQSIQGQQLWKTPDGYMTGKTGQQGFGASSDVTSLLNDFQNYQKDQSNSNQAWQKYATLSAQQAGGQGSQTILGSALSPYQSILAAQNAQSTQMRKPGMV